MKKKKRVPSLPSVSLRLSEKIRGIISKLGQPAEIEWMRTGIHAFDLMCGDGIPLGRIMEIYGDESTGKSLLAWTIAKAWQEQGGLVVVFDTEATAPKRFMERVGVNMESLIYRKPETIEELEKEFFIIHSSLLKAEPDLKILYIHDSVAATTSANEWEWDKKQKMNVPKETAEMGSRARAMSRLTRHISITLSKSNSTYIAVNQVRDKIGVMFGEKTTTPGGRGLKFHASIRVQLNRGGRIDQLGSKPIGVICNAFIKKNKCAEPFRKSPLRIIWKTGFEATGGLAEFLETQGRITALGAGKYKYRNLRFRARNIHRIINKRKELIEAML